MVSEKNYHRLKIEYFILALLIVWGFLIAIYRNYFRKMVYRTNDWKININPYFLKEIKALLGNIYPYDKNYIRLRNIYRFQLIMYFILVLSYQIVHKNAALKNELRNSKKLETETIKKQYKNNPYNYEQNKNWR